VREQMPHRRPRRAGRGVEVDDALLDRHLHRTGDQWLGHRREGEPALGVAELRQHAGRPDHRGCGGRDRPVGKGIQRAHRGGA
jgi:hypothetical protein